MGTFPRVEQASPGQSPGWRLAAFSSLAIPASAATQPLNVYLPALLTQHYGLPLATIGLVFLIERLWGAAVDPVIGVLSDRTQSRLGPRRSWILAGGLLFALATVALFFPPVAISVPYLIVALFAFYTAWAMIQIPYLAWSGEIASDYHERTRVQTFVHVAGAASPLLVLVLPTILDQIRPGDIVAKQSAFGLFILASLAIALPLALRSFGDPPRNPAPSRAGLRASLSLIVRQRLLRRVILSDFAVVCGQTIRGTLFVFFVAMYMGRPEWASGLFLLQYVFGVAAGPIWLRVARRFGKHHTAVAGESVQVVINLGLLLVSPDEFALLLALTIAQGLAQGSGNLMLRSMVADVADKHRLESGQDQTALFFSAFSISAKAATAVAAGIVLPLIGWLGFDPKGENSPQALQGLLTVFALGPALAHAASALIIARFDLDEAAHSEIRRKLDAGDPALAPAE